MIIPSTSHLLYILTNASLKFWYFYFSNYSFVHKPFIFLFLMLAQLGHTQAQEPTNSFTRQDTLRGSVGPERAWWNATQYNILVQPDYTSKSIRGTNDLSFTVLSKGSKMQIDLQEPMQITAIKEHGRPVPFYRDGNVFFVRWPSPLKPGLRHTISIDFAGTPKAAVRPPWDGGWIWSKDRSGAPWMSVACQGLGASVWYPCKDHQSDEPDSAILRIVVPDSLVAVGNGRLRAKQSLKNGLTMYTWAVVNPINNYDIIPYIGKYANFTETFDGEKGPLYCSYWVLAEDLAKAQTQFTQTRPMLKCFENWFGPYPFYEDGYKLVQAPHLGMEHQSAVAYGNRFANGYLGRDLSGSGWGMKWDFIIVHESGHEWFGNNITSKDLADMWVHESFTNYSETLYTECQFGKEAGNDYVIGTRKNITNKTPIIAAYGVNAEGSGDMYYKGGNMLHTIRQVMNNDSSFRAMLRGLNKTFYHQTVTTKQVEQFISNFAKTDFSTVFDEYLRTTMVPVLEYKIDSSAVSVRYTNVVKDFNLPLKVTLDSKSLWIKPTADWSNIPGSEKVKVFTVDRNFYVESKMVL
jgi:aminopeptidase N